MRDLLGIIQEYHRPGERDGKCRVPWGCPYHQVNSYFLRAKISENTSDQEGSPISFRRHGSGAPRWFPFFETDGLIASEDVGSVPEYIRNGRRNS